MYNLTFIFILSFACWVLMMWLTQFGPAIAVPYWKRGGGGGTATTTNYYYYKLSLPHQNISPNRPIFFYDAYGILVYSIGANDSNMNYGVGVYSVPGDRQNLVIESISTADYYVEYSTDDIFIDYDNCAFYLNDALINKPTEVTVWSTFQYYATFTAANDTGKIIDGDWNTQMQTVFYAEPPAGYEYAILDFGTVKDVQVVDLICGFFRPTDEVKFNCSYNVTLKYSNDGVNYYNIGKDAVNFEMSSGTSKTFEEDSLGFEFQTRYLKFILERVNKINYDRKSITVTNKNYKQLVDAGIINLDAAKPAGIGDVIILREGLYAVALTEASAYSNIVLKSEAFLIPCTKSTSSVESGNVVNVLDTSAFSNFGVVFIDKDITNYFTYTGKTPTTFTGVELISGGVLHDDSFLSQDVETDTTLYDYNYLLPKLGDRTYKKDQSKTEYLYTESDLNYLAKAYLKEFVKNHGKMHIVVMFSPYYKVGQTVEITDSYNKLNKVRYFIESVTHTANTTNLVVARYPGD